MISEYIRDPVPEPGSEPWPPVRVEYRTDGNWAGVMQMPSLFGRALTRYYLYQADIPYWSLREVSSAMTVDLDGRCVRLPVAYTPGPEWTVLEIDVPRPIERPV